MIMTLHYCTHVKNDDACKADVDGKVGLDTGIPQINLKTKQQLCSPNVTINITNKIMFSSYDR